MVDKSTARVGVLMGGISPERPISMKSGAAVSRALRARGWTVVDIDVGRDLPAQLLANRVTHAWLALHGPLGEDGCVQGLLEVMRVPYTGSNVRGSAIAMDKIATKRCLRDTGIPMAKDRSWRRGDDFPVDLKFPAMVKTPEGGSTLGIRKVHDAAELEAGLLYCLDFAPEVLIEEFIEGYEITVAVLEGTPLPVVKIEPLNEIFDFAAKYEKGKTRYLVPAPIPEAVATRAQHYARTAYTVLGLSGVARADFIVDADGTPWFLEINTLPGMTETSLSPMAAGQVGMSFEDLVERLLHGARCHVPDFARRR
ncbi:MAG: D-alanine--D-alanine ligase [Deltaproteobacteria bacterium]|nr:D-alanine--D-alanine ligase [Deltaproteobacteria bacterium]